MSDRMLTSVGDSAVVDLALPFLETIAAPDRLTEFFAAHVLPSRGPGRDITTVRLDDVTYTPGHKCVVLCSLVPAGGAEAPIQRALVTMTRGDRLAGEYQRTYAKGPPESALFVSEVGALIEFFPSDHALPTLGQAATPEHMGPVLARLDESHQFDRPPHVEFLHYRPHRRCVLAYRPAADDDAPSMVAKLYRPGSEARDAWERLDFAHTQLAQNGIVVPRPFPLVDELNLVVMARVAGTMLKTHLQGPGPSSDKEAAVTMTARLLATLHRLPAEAVITRTIDGELRSLRKRAEPLQIVAPDLARRVHGLIQRIARQVSGCASVTPCFIHGDFTPSQLLLTNEGAALLDFDLAGPGDPAIDVANFATKLRRRARRTGDDEYRSLVTAFLDEYQQHARTDASFLLRVQVLESLALVRTAVRAFRHGPFPTTDRTIPSLPHLFLDEAEASLVGD